MSNTSQFANIYIFSGILFATNLHLNLTIASLLNNKMLRNVQIDIKSSNFLDYTDCIN
jgi:hypothetical protein